MCNHDLKLRNRIDCCTDNGKTNRIVFSFLYCERCGHVEFVKGNKKLFDKQFGEKKEERKESVYEEGNVRIKF